MINFYVRTPNLGVTWVLFLKWEVKVLVVIIVADFMGIFIVKEQSENSLFPT